jgi:hypothetical protein
MIDDVRDVIGVQTRVDRMGDETGNGRIIDFEVLMVAPAQGPDARALSQAQPLQRRDQLPRAAAEFRIGGTMKASVAPAADDLAARGHRFRPAQDRRDSQL